MKCKYCDKESMYVLETSEGEIHVCESCDEDFTMCAMCGKAVPVEEARFLNDEDDMKTCYECVTIREEEGFTMRPSEKVEQLKQLLDIAKENYQEHCVNENGEIYKKDIRALEWAIRVVNENLVY